MAAALLTAACSDSSSDASNVDYEDGSSSSVAPESSSSVEKESSSSAGERAATLEDFGAHKNKYLDGLVGTKIFMATGSQKGLVSFWLPRKELQTIDSAWVVVQSNLKNGVLEINKDNTVFLGISDDKGAGAAMKELLSKGAKIKFIVNKDGKLQYSLNEGEYKAVVDTALNMPAGYLTNGDKLMNKRFSCEKAGVKDTSFVYTFYDGRYIAEKVVGSDTVSWVAGYSDIQKGKLLLMKPEAMKTTTYSELRTASVSTDNKLSFVTGIEESCKAVDIKPASVSRDKLVATWNGSLKSDSWMMTLKQDGSFSMQNVVATQGRQGTWLVYGDVLMMNNKACKPNDCESAIKGNIVGFDAKQGFTFNHSDKEGFPEKWTLPVSE